MEYAGDGMKCAGKDLEKAGRGGKGDYLGYLSRRRRFRVSEGGLLTKSVLRLVLIGI